VTRPSPAWLTADVRRVQAHHAHRVAEVWSGAAPGPVHIDGRFFGRAHGLWGTDEPDMLEEPEEWLADVLADMGTAAEWAGDERTFRPLYIELDPLGTHFIDALLGAGVYFHEGQVWSDQLTCGIGELEPPDLRSGGLLRKAARLAELALAATGGCIPIALPVFSCPVNTGTSVFGQRLLEALVCQPADAARALRVVTDCIIAAVRALHAVVSAGLRLNSVACNRFGPEGFGQIDGCATQLVSAEHYARFFAPLDAALLRAWPAQAGLIHLCGAHAQHIPTWRGMPEIRAVQLNDRAAEDLELYAGGLREDQVIYVAPTPTMPPERILEAARGRRLVAQWSAP